MIAQLPQSVLHPAGPQAYAIAREWWIGLAIAAVVYLLTIGALAWATWRGRQRLVRAEGEPVDADRRMTRVVGLATAATVAILLVWIGIDLVHGRALRPPSPARHVTIELVGHQWWWEARYRDTLAQHWVTTANELHIPVGRPVLLALGARDVIHSVWVPNLAGKKDLVPGYTDSLWIQADRPGVWRGQCAEFCGHQHAKMALQVIAHPPAEYDAWLVAQRQPAPTPTDSLTLRGREVFLAAQCALCHAVEGTLALSRAGPDLTHLASRSTIAAGTLPNTRGNLAGWIVDPQRIKPGTHMPSASLSPADLDALLTYLQSLR